MATKLEVCFMIGMAMFIGFMCIVASTLLAVMANDLFHLRPWGWLIIIPAAAYWIWMLPQAVRDWR